MPLLFATTMFLSALLLFLVQPMIGKMTLPLLGGTPAVWNTCMVFFQALLLGGYLYAHGLTKERPFATQSRIHYAVLVLALGAMAAGGILSQRHTPIPILKSLAPAGDEIPFFSVIVVLGVAVGLPFLVLSTSAPLLQKWFTETGHPSAKDPYFLYGASNFGSLLSLVGYPFLVEPYFTVIQQSYIWAVGYILLVGLIVACGRSVSRSQAAQEERAKYASKPKSHTVSNADPNELAPGRWTMLRWLGLAFVPSSLMCGVTTYISTDIASLPLLWVIPLALYLVTFIIAFSRLPSWVNLVITLFTPVVILLLLFVPHTGEARLGFMGKIALHIGVFFIVSLCSHCELARLRPKNTRYLTNFYLAMSVGGMLGGLFNALFAPLVFTYISEYTLTLVIGCLLLPKLDTRTEDRPTPFDFLMPMALFGLTYMALDFFYQDTLYYSSWFYKQCSYTGADGEIRNFSSNVRAILFYGLPIMLTYLFVERPLRFGLGVLAVWLAFSRYDVARERLNALENHLPEPLVTRSFFGVLRVEIESEKPENEFIRLMHGTTLHGKQFRRPDMEIDDRVLREIERCDPADDAKLAKLTEMKSIMEQNRAQVSLWNEIAPAMAALGGGPLPLETAASLSIVWPELRSADLKPLTYYHPTGPVGYIQKALRDRLIQDPNANTDTACIGLGTGSLSAYGVKGQNVTFFEIDPVVRKLVEPGHYFNYVKAAKERGVNIQFEMGDARLTLERLDRKYALMFVDAFSSDAIPVHLLTKEAMELYFSRLTEDGLLAVHISNRYLDLEPVVKKLAEAVGVAARVMSDDDEGAPGKTRSTWILLTRKLDYMGPFVLGAKSPPGVYRYYPEGRPVWQELGDNRKVVPVWTDDFSPVIPIMKNDLRFWKKTNEEE